MEGGRRRMDDSIAGCRFDIKVKEQAEDWLKVKLSWMLQSWWKKQL
jgi:hypothetical protein